MKNILIAYDLHKLGQRYSGLRDLIKKSFPTYWACLDSTFIVKTDMTCAQVRALCNSQLDINDSLLAIEVGADWAVQGVTGNCLDWLREHVAP